MFCTSWWDQHMYKPHAFVFFCDFISASVHVPLLPVIIPSTWQPELGPSVRGFITCAMNTFWPLRYYLFSVEQMWRDGCIVSKGVASNVKEHRGTNEHLPYFAMCMYISYAIMMAGSNMPV